MTRRLGAQCPFCEIVAGRLDADVVDAGRRWLAFKPLKAATPGHVLFVPRRHVTSAVEAPLTTGLIMAAAARYLGAVGPQGNILTSAGPEATQSVFHLHVHVVPRGPSDTLHEDWPWEGLR